MWHLPRKRFLSALIWILKLQCKRKNMVVESVRKKVMVGSLVLVFNQDMYVFCFEFKKYICKYYFSFTWHMEAVVCVVHILCICKGQYLYCTSFLYNIWINKSNTYYSIGLLHFNALLFIHPKAALHCIIIFIRFIRFPSDRWPSAP